ncbi:T9SS type A sorting domain-containing protein [Candidatus Desantisbacteria bacterium]|nr:T9SS type A sorting domain-containing protein [Candidatus Desantisbacteria bacterium]
MKRIIFILILLILTQGSQHLFAATLPQVLSLTIEIAPLSITTAEDGYSIVRADGYAVSSKVGMPMLPIKAFFVLLPPCTEVDRIEITSIQQEKLAGKYLLKSVSPPLPVGTTHCSCLSFPLTEQAVRLESIQLATDTDKNVCATLPEQVVHLESIQQWGGFNLACMQVSGARYDAQAGELTWIKQVEFTLKLRQVQDISVSGRCPNPGALQKLVINPELIPGYSSAPTIKRYLIVTDETLAPAFQTLLNSKISKGFEGTITFTSWIYSHESGRDHQERIRNYIKDYQPTYLLLGGDTGIVPYRGVYAWVEGGTLDDESFFDYNIPCDMYYACLDGDWDYDKDGIYGEVEDRVDMLPEVFVGRAPVNIACEAEDFVAKVLRFGSATGSSQYNEMLIGCEFDRLNDGKLIMQAIDEITPGEYDVSRYYGSEGADRDSIMNGLNDSVGLVAHAGHANNSCIQAGNSYLYNYDIRGLSNPNPFIFNTIGCYAGAFDYTDCIGEQMVMDKDGGAAAFIGNSRYGLYDETSPMFYSGEYQIEFFRAALREGYSHIGEALAMSKLTFVPECNTDTPYRWVQYCLNLLGDPEMALPMPTGIHALYHVIQGNVDGIVAPGQQLPLIITLKNFRDNDYGSLSVELSTDDLYVIITTKTVTLDALLSGGLVDNTNQPFGFMITSNCPYEHKIRFTLTINDNAATCTDTIYLTVSLIASSIDNIICYPNPCVRQHMVTIANIPTGKDAMVYIYNISGEMVRKIEGTELTAGGSMIARWDTTNDNGERVASGIYFYRLICSKGVKTGKIGIVR